MAERRADCIQFIGRLAEGHVPEATPEQLDALLHWLAGRGNEMARSVAAAFDFHDVPRETARRRTMIYLDATLFAHEQDGYRVFGLTPDCGFADIRNRHKQLMQVLHPDRHDDNPEWFTERSERINHAYADLKANHGRPTTPRAKPTVAPPPTSRQPSPKTAPAPRPWQALFADKDKLRRQLKTHLGNPANLERRVYVILVLVPVILLVVVFVHQTQFNGPQERDTVVDRTQDPGNRNADTAPELRHPDELIESPVATDSQTAQASTRNTTKQAEAAPREPDAILPTIRDEDAIAADAVNDPETGAKPDVQVITAVQAAAAAEPEPAEPDSAEIPAAAATTTLPTHTARQPEQAKAPDKQQRAPPEPTRGLPAIRAFLNQYQAAYNISDIDRFTRLFQQNATTKHASSRSEIAEKYRSLFNRTRDRNLVFKDVRVEQIDERQYKVNTRYEVNWTYPDGESKTDSGRFEMLLVTEGENLKIWRLDY